MGLVRLQRVKQVVARKLKRVSSRYGPWFGVHLESVMLLVIVGLFALLCLFRVCEFFSFPQSNDVAGVLGTIVQSLASIFAIVFSISLVAIQLCSEGLSHRLIGLYVWSWSFVGPFSLNLGTLLFNWLLLSNVNWRHSADYGIFWSFGAVLSLVPFFIYTRFLSTQLDF